jgi:anti-sigma B factor antagonist
MSLNLDLINRGAEGELVLSGRLDSVTSEEAGKVFDEVAERFDSLILNMKDLDYISSAGLRLIKRAYMTMRRKGGSLKLKNVNKMVMEVFEVTGFAGLLQFI